MSGVSLRRFARRSMFLLLVSLLAAPVMAGPVTDPAAFHQCMQICSMFAPDCLREADMICRESPPEGSSSRVPGCLAEGLGECLESMPSCRTGCLSIKYPPVPEARRSPGRLLVEGGSVRP